MKLEKEINKKIKNIRNFSIIAHIDHGKSTLSDRLIEVCGGLNTREMRNQVLDNMDIEKERGITIKAQSVVLEYNLNNSIYYLNFIDTPGHVDFSYEVSRSLSACEGALLVVDSSQGVEAQTVSVCQTAIEHGLKILPVINKIDLPQANPEKTIKEIYDIIGIETNDSILISSKTGFGINDLLKRIISTFPYPKGNPNSPLQALIIDSWYDKYLGVISLVRVVNGIISMKDKIQIMSSKKTYTIEKIGIFTPKPIYKQFLISGEVGFIIANIKDIHGAPVGDTIILQEQTILNEIQQLSGFKQIKPQVFASIFPTDSNDYTPFRNALEKLSLNDASLTYEPETSKALGFGFRCGFLGMLHMDIVKERLEREYDLSLIITAPSVIYEILKKNNTIVYIDSPSKLPQKNEISEIREPIANAHIISPHAYIGNIMKLCTEKRGRQISIQYFEHNISILYELPLNEIIVDFFDKLKSVTKGYASLNYHFSSFNKSNLEKLDILINGDKIDALSSIIYKDQVMRKARELVEKIKTLIPRQLFEVAIQAAIGSQIVCRGNIKALRKNVIEKCYGGDVTRKNKLLKKQKAGKKKMKKIGKIEIPKETFLNIIK